MTNYSFCQQFGGGIIAGLSGSQLSGDQLAGFNKIGLNSGVFTDLQISKKGWLRFELIYLQKGSNNPDKDLRHEYILNYLEIPLIFQYSTNKKTKLEIGIYTGFLITSKEKDAISNTYISSRESFSKSDNGFIFGLNYSLSKRFSLNTRFSNTFFFTPVRKHASGVSQWFNQGQYNSLLSFSIIHHIF